MKVFQAGDVLLRPLALTFLFFDDLGGRDAGSTTEMFSAGVFVTRVFSEGEFPVSPPFAAAGLF